MKKIKALSLICALLLGVSLSGCASTEPDGTDVDRPDSGISDGTGANNGSAGDANDNGNGGSGGTDNGTASGPAGSEWTAKAEKTIESEIDSPQAIPSGATRITAANLNITKAGNYYADSVISDKIYVQSAGVYLYLSGATLSNKKKVIESDYGFTLTLLGNNNVSNTNADGSNAIDCAGDLVINGNGSLTVSSTKNGIKANSITVVGATLDINADKDGLHAEIDKYDEAATEPTPDYSDGGYVYLSGANVTITSADDGIQADTFVYIADKSTVNIRSGGGAYDVVGSEVTSGKGIKAGAIDWGADAVDLKWNGYLVCIKSGEIDINANDDAIRSNGDIEIMGGKIYITSSADGIDAENSLYVLGGEIYISGPVNDVNGAIVYGKSATITGGTVVAAFAKGATSNFDVSSTQGSVFLYTDAIGAGAVALKDGDNNTLASYSPTVGYNAVLISCPDLKKGESYTVSVAGKSVDITLTELIFNRSF